METVACNADLPCISTISHSELSNRISYLSASELFSALTPAQCTRVALVARHRTFERGKLLFAQGEPLEKLFLLTSGFVKLLQANSQGNEVILGLRGPHDVIDVPIEAVFSVHNCTAKVVLSATALTWKTSDLRQMIHDIPQINLNIMRILAQDLTELQARFHEVSSEKVEARLARTLIRLFEEFGRPTSEGLALSMSRLELAQVASTTLFAVSRLVSRWSELGLISPRRETLLMLDTRRFQSVACHDDLCSEGRGELRVPPRRPSSVQRHGRGDSSLPRDCA